MLRFVLPALVLAGVAAPTLAQDTRASVNTRVRAEFARADRNRDGALSRGEVTRRVVATYGGRGMTTGRSRILTNMWFGRLDANKDNAITRAEAQRQVAGLFARFDTNRDGRIGPRERAAADSFLRNPAR